MKLNEFAPWRHVVLALLVGLAGGTALAEKPEWAGRNGKGAEDRNEREHDRKAESRNGRDRGGAGVSYSGGGVEIRIGGYFNDGQRSAAHDYYGREFRSGGSCPPGLAKKNNGCMPPGQAKKWGVGRPLPSDVVYYPVAPEVSIRLGVPPAGYKYVRVAKDILLIAVGTSMVVDAIEDLGR